MKILAPICIILFSIGLFLLVVTNCNFLIESNCFCGYTLIGVCCCALSIIIPTFHSIIEWFIKLITKHEEKKD